MIVRRFIGRIGGLRASTSPLEIKRKLCRDSDKPCNLVVVLNIYLDMTDTSANILFLAATVTISLKKGS